MVRADERFCGSARAHVPRVPAHLAGRFHDGRNGRAAAAPRLVGFLFFAVCFLPVTPASIGVGAAFAVLASVVVVLGAVRFWRLQEGMAWRGVVVGAGVEAWVLAGALGMVSFLFGAFVGAFC